MKWSVSTVLLLSIAASSYADPTPPPDAQTLYNQTLAPYMGSGANVQKNLVSPMVSGGLQTTIDGQTSFQTTTFNASQKPLLKITINPNPTTGDIRNVEVDQDLTGSGTLSTVSFFPSGGSQMISGICANGIIACNPGTYTNCSYYLWSTDATGMVITPSTTSFADMQSCYCFNQSCSSTNNSALMNIDALTADISAGVISTFVTNTNSAITNTMSAGLGVVECFGTKPAASVKGLTSAGASTDGTGSVIPANTSTTQGLYDVYPYTDTATLTSTFTSSDPTQPALNSMGQSALTSQKNSPYSIYNLVSNTMSGASTGISTHSCTNTRQESVSAQTKSVGKSGTLAAGHFGADHQVTMVVTQTNPYTWALGLQGYNPGYGYLNPFYPVDPQLRANAYLLDIFQPFSITTTGDASNFIMNQVDINVSLSGSGCNSGDGQVTLIGTGSEIGVPQYTNTTEVCGASGVQSPSASWTFTAIFQEQQTAQAIVDGCAEYEQDPTCQLQTDIWDGRPVITNYTPTGFQLSQIVRNFSGPVRSVQVYADWWVQNRTYYCNHAPSPYDFTSALAQESTVSTTASLSGTTMTYTDNSGQESATVPAMGPLAPCPQVCKTQTPIQQSKIDITGPQINYQSASGQAAMAFTFVYKDCVAATDGSGSYTCPLNQTAGETVLIACGCSADFGEAVSSISTLDAAQDAICSNN